MRPGRSILIILIMLAGVLEGYSQSDSMRISMPYPVHSQYLQNGLVINPAYAGSREALSVFASYRLQWVGLDYGSPSYETFSIHSLMKNNKVGLGLTAQFLKYGPTKGTGVYAMYTYHLQVGKARLSLGLKGGFDMANTNYTGLDYITHPDGAFEGDYKPYFMPNVGAGFYLYSKKFFLGAAIPQFFSYVKQSDGKISFNTFSKFDIQASAGALIRFADAFKFKPSVFIEYSLDKAKNMRIDLNGNFIISDLVWVGGSWRTSEKVAVGILQVQLNPQIMIGYSYDYPLGTMSTYASGSHEIVLRYEFGYKVTAANPRYF